MLEVMKALESWAKGIDKDMKYFQWSEGRCG